MSKTSQKTLDAIALLRLLSADPTNSKVKAVDAAERVLLADADILKPSETLVTLDTEGNSLVKNGRYRFRGEICLVTYEEFGCGNMLDRYYRVFYKGPDQKECFTVVEVKYSRDFGPSYPSDFEPIKELEDAG